MLNPYKEERARNQTRKELVWFNFTHDAYLNLNADIWSNIDAIVEGCLRRGLKSLSGEEYHNCSIHTLRDLIFDASIVDDDPLCMRLFEEHLLIILNNGVDINSQGRGYSNACFDAVKCDSPTVLNILIKNGVDVDNFIIKAIDDIKYPIHAAIFGDDTQCLKLLVDAGADIESKSRRGYTALLLAAESNCLGSFEFLLEAGADVNAKNNSGRSWMDIARSQGFDGIISTYERHEISKLKLINSVEYEATGL